MNGERYILSKHYYFTYITEYTWTKLLRENNINELSPLHKLVDHEAIFYHVWWTIRPSFTISGGPQGPSFTISGGPQGPSFTIVWWTIWPSFTNKAHEGIFQDTIALTGRILPYLSAQMKQKCYRKICLHHLRHIDICKTFMGWEGGEIQQRNFYKKIIIF